MIADRSNPVRTVSRTKWATCPEGTKSWIDGGSSQTWSTSQARNVLLIPRLNHDAPSSSRKIRLLGQAPSSRDSNFVNIGMTDLIDKRIPWVVPRKPGGALSDYVPFYFTPRSM